jgi:hypothetical protein
MRPQMSAALQHLQSDWMLDCSRQGCEFHQGSCGEHTDEQWPSFACMAHWWALCQCSQAQRVPQQHRAATARREACSHHAAGVQKQHQLERHVAALRVCSSNSLVARPPPNQPVLAALHCCLHLVQLIHHKPRRSTWYCSLNVALTSWAVSAMCAEPWV